MFLEILKRLVGERPPEPTKIFPKPLETLHRFLSFAFGDHKGVGQLVHIAL